MQKAHLSWNGVEKWDSAAAGPTAETWCFQLTTDLSMQKWQVPEADTAPQNIPPPSSKDGMKVQGVGGVQQPPWAAHYRDRFLSPFSTD